MPISVLRPGQQEVAAYRGGYLAVPAVPGAGKTSILAYLGAELVASGAVGNGKLLVVTYLNSSVANFRKKLIEELAARGKGNLSHKFEVKTLHSLAAKIVRERPDVLQVSDEMPVIDGDRRYRLINRLLRQWLQNPENHKAWISVVRKRNRNNEGIKRWLKDCTDYIEKAINYFKAHKLRYDYLETHVKSLPFNSFLRWAIEIYGSYEAELRRQGLCDFDDLILYALDLLQADKELLGRMQSRWTYIFEDEAQDSTPLQEEMLRLLAGEKGNLVRVGDTNQAISSTFTAADPELFKKFCAEMELQDKVQPLLYASRSTREIIGAANALVNWVRNDHPDDECKSALADQPINPIPHDVPGPKNPPNPSIPGALVIRYGHREKEREDVALRVKEYLEKEKDGKAAILCRTNWDIDKMAKELEKLGVPYRIVNGSMGEIRNTLKALCSWIDFLVNPHDGGRLEKALEMTMIPELKDEPELAEFLRSARVEQIIYPQPGEPLEKVVPEEIRAHELWPRIVKAVERVTSWLGASRLPPESLVMYLAEELGLEGDHMAMAQRLAQEFQVRSSRDPHARLVDLVGEVMENDKSFNYFIKMLSERAGFEPSPGEVTLSTCHSAKGLEWDAVFATGMNSFNFPTTMEDPMRGELRYLEDDAANPAAVVKAELAALESQGPFDPDKAKHLARAESAGEHLRLLYVTITRAKKYLRLTFGGKREYLCKALDSLVNKGVLKYYEPKQ